MQNDPKDKSNTFASYDCPECGIDFDLEPLPPFGTAVACSGCGGFHRLGIDVQTNAWREIDGSLECINREWEAGEEPCRPRRIGRFVFDQPINLTKDECLQITRDARGKVVKVEKTGKEEI